MKRVFASSIVLCLLLTLGQSAFAQGANDSKRASLYDRIGGSEAIGKIFDEVGGRMAADPLLAKFFQGQSQEALMAQRNQTIAFLCHEFGGPCDYNGRTPKQAHAGLAINEAQWKAFMKHITETLDNQKVGPKEKSEFIAVVKRFKSDVVTKK